MNSPLTMKKTPSAALVSLWVPPRIDRAMETCGHAPWQILAEASGLLNAIMFDIKSLNAKRHLEFTGRPPDMAVNNLQRLVTERPSLRTPVIPGFNDTEQDIEDICLFLAELPSITYELLPYHRLGTQKYYSLGREAPMGDATLASETFLRLEALARTRLGAKYTA